MIGHDAVMIESRCIFDYTPNNLNYITTNHDYMLWSQGWFKLISFHLGV